MQNVYTQKTPFGEFRSDKPLSHGVSIFLIIQSILYFALGFMAFCGILYHFTNPDIIFKIQHCHSLPALGNVLLDALETIGEKILVYYGVAVGLFTTLAVASVAVVIFRTIAFDRFRNEVTAIAILEDPANELTEQDCDLTMSFSLGSGEQTDTADSPPSDLLAQQEQNNRGILNLYNIVGTSKRGEILLHTSRVLREQAAVVTDSAERDKLSKLSDKFYAHHLKNRTLRLVNGDPQELLQDLNISAVFADVQTEETGGIAYFTVTVPATTQPLSDAGEAVIDGLFRVSVKINGETVSKLNCLLPINGTASPSTYIGYYPAPEGEYRSELVIEPISLWLMEKP